jgi:Neocarzinostatin family
VKRLIFVVVSMIATTVTSGLVAAPAGASPLVNVTPSSGLVDAQPVDVSANGYTADTQLAVIECTTSATSQDDCDLSTLVFTSADASGNVSTTYAVFREIFPASNPAGLDCAPSNCVLVVANISDQTEAASAALSFDPSIPLPPSLQITATIDHTGSFDRAGNVKITGIVTCSLPVDVYLQVGAIQRAGRVLLHAYGFAEIPCDGPTQYSLTASPYDGIFRGGDASVQLDYTAFSGRRNVYGTVSATVQLRGAGR